MSYEKKIIYLSCVENDKRICNGGHVKLERRGAKFIIDMQVNLKRYAYQDKFEVIVDGNDQSYPLGLIYLSDGTGNLRKEIEHQFSYEDICEIRMAISDKIYVIGKVKEPTLSSINFESAEGKDGYKDGQFMAEHPGKEWQYAAAPSSIDENGGDKGEGIIADISDGMVVKVTVDMPDGRVAEAAAKMPDGKAAEAAVDMMDGKANEETETVAEDEAPEAVRQILNDIRMVPDKWQLLLKNYRQLNPYEDERIYISIEPKDFVIMSSEYQQLAHNSFLLHGFYNYRHIILGREDEDYYLGVPGVFYEREKSVAMMFGFEVFECEGGKAENGKFGYYLKKVKV